MTTEKERSYFVGGINGVGKTTLLKEIGARDSSFEIIRGSWSFMQWLGIKPGDYDSLRLLPDDFKDEELDKMMRWLLTQRPGCGKHLLFDAHFLNIKPDEIVDATGEWIGLMDGLMVVTAENDEILNRIELDQTNSGRSRPLFKEGLAVDQKLGLIGQFQEKTLEAARRLAQTYGLPLIEIPNNDGNLIQAVDNFIDFHKSF